ncbi:MAG: CBS domain-containing protein [Planctomycetota bacterium]|nr:CBS domain-containing protein [Planctomycetota bacterium]
MAGKELLVKDHMRTPVYTISAEAGLDRALLIMRSQRVRHLPVVENGSMIGLISDRDLRLSMQEMEQGPGGAPKGYYLPALKKVRTVMATKVVTAAPEMTLVEAAKIMSENKFGALPVVEPESKKVVGMITETDMLRLLMKLLQDKSTEG